MFASLSLPCPLSLSFSLSLSPIFLVPSNENNYYVTLHSIINIYNGDDYCVAQNYNLSRTKDLARVSLDFHQPLCVSFTRSAFFTNFVC